MRIICKLQDVAGGLRIEDRIEVSGAQLHKKMRYHSNIEDCAGRLVVLCGAELMQKCKFRPKCPRMPSFGVK